MIVNTKSEIGKWFEVAKLTEHPPNTQRTSACFYILKDRVCGEKNLVVWEKGVNQWREVTEKMGRNVSQEGGISLGPLDSSFVIIVCGHA